MTRKENERDSRQKILDAALDAFYEAGFDGARVDAIAKKAGVNQALIYYYFKSKEELFSELINANVNELISAKNNAIGEKDIFDRNVIREVIDKMLDTLREKEKVFSIMMGELYRNSHRKNYEAVFGAFMPAIRGGKEKLLALGADRKDIDREIIAGIFFGSVPMITYATLGEKLTDYYGIDKESLDKIFTEFIYRFSEDYVEFLKNRMKVNSYQDLL